MKRKLKKGVVLLIHTKNEEKNIAECIKSAQVCADQIIVLDQQSTDNTRDIAKNWEQK